MSPQGIKKTFDLGNGQEVTIETGRLAKQADGAVVLRQGNTMLLATVVSNKDAKDEVDFLPLTVDYKEKYAATGKFPGGFFKREGRNSEYEILICRIIDRAMRPLFPDDYHADTQLMISLISADNDTMPDALAGLAASAAITISDIPFDGPISECRVARIDGELVINPGIEALEGADIDLLVGGTAESIVMVEGEMSEVSEADMLSAINFAHVAIKGHCKAQIEFAEMVNKAKREYEHEVKDDELKQRINDACYQKCYDIAAEGCADKHERSAKFKAVKQEFVDSLSEEEAAEKKFLIGQYFHKVEKEGVRNCMLDTKKRLDGRDLDEIRDIWCEVDYLPSAHGSALFTRGETQSLTTVTMGTKLDKQLIDGAIFKGYNDFYLHYNFPSFSTGEARPNRGTSRREVGHGNLAERALKKMIPEGEENPYTIRIVSDILESNGSSSMATVCAGSLALMDAGVKIKKPVSGIAMGLITNDEGKYIVLSDILGDEDHLGDMDFKVTGTEDGITACQMDIKVGGLSSEIMTQALDQAKRARLHILDKMKEALTAPRDNMKPHAPRIIELSIPKESIGAVIGPGGKVIQEMQLETNTTIHIEEIDGFGVVQIFSENEGSINAAVDKIKGITAIPEVGEEYESTVKNIMPYGAFVEFLPGKEGLLHISEVSWKRIENLDDHMKVGDKVKVKLLEVDKKTGKFKLSSKVLTPKPNYDRKPEASN